MTVCALTAPRRRHGGLAAGRQQVHSAHLGREGGAFVRASDEVSARELTATHSTHAHIHTHTPLCLIDPL